jgi:hypothetical protein
MTFWKTFWKNASGGLTCKAGKWFENTSPALDTLRDAETVLSAFSRRR